TLLDELRFLRQAYGKQITLVVSGAPGFRWAQPETLEAMLNGIEQNSTESESESDENDSDDDAVARRDGR
ncbi:MAG: hypothetical protein AAGF47_11660, partial [Planctomycetota bacterium]